jgi:hypothetical protein
MRIYATVLVAGLVALTGVLFGFWWAPFPVGIAVGAVMPRARTAIPTAAAIGLLAWLIPLAATHVRYGLGPTATSLAAIMGFDHLAALPVILTLVVGTVVGLTGGWLGSAGRAVAAPNARVDAARNG